MSDTNITVILIKLIFIHIFIYCQLGKHYIIKKINFLPVEQHGHPAAFPAIRRLRLQELHLSTGNIYLYDLHCRR